MNITIQINQQTEFGGDNVKSQNSIYTIIFFESGISSKLHLI